MLELSMPECWARIEWEDEMTVHTGSTDRKEGVISRLKVGEQAGGGAATWVAANLVPMGCRHMG